MFGLATRPSSDVALPYRGPSADYDFAGLAKLNSYGASVLGNGDFADASVWNRVGKVSLATPGFATFFASGEAAEINQGTLTVGTRYRIDFEISEYVSGAIFPFVGFSGNGGAQSGNGKKSVELECVGNGSFYLSANASGFVGRISKVRARPVIPHSLPGLTYSRNGNATTVCPNRLGPDIITNGSLSSDTVWTKGGGWSIGSGVATRTGAGDSSIFQSPSGLQAGHLYLIEFDVLTLGSGYVIGFVGGGYSLAMTTTGRYSAVVLAVNTTNVQVYAESTSCVVDNIGVRELILYDPADPISLVTVPPNVPRLLWERQDGPELLPNPGGPFASTAGLTAIGGATVIAQGGEIVVTQASSGQFGGFVAAFSGTTVGKRYRVRFQLVAKGGPGSVYVNLSVTGTTLTGGASLGWNEFEYTAAVAPFDLGVAHSNANAVSSVFGIKALSVREIGAGAYACAGLLREPERTNILPERDIYAGTWSQHVPGTIQAEQAPDGFGRRVSLPAVGGIYTSSPTAVADGVRYEPSFRIWPVAASTGNLAVNHPYTGTNGQWQIDRSRLVPGQWNYISRRHPAVTVVYEFKGYDTAGYNGMYLLWATADPPVDFFFDCPQMEVGTFPTSYIPTAGAAATRAAEVHSLNTNAGGSGDGAILLDCDVRSAIDTGTGAYPLGLDEEGAMCIYVGASYTYAGIYAVAAAAPTTRLGLGRHKVAASFGKNSESRIAIDGTGYNNGTPYDPHMPVTLKLGSVSQSMHMLVRRARIWPRTMSSAELLAEVV